MDETRLDAVAAPEARAALRYVRAQAAPVTADDLAAAEGIHRNVARARLERLAAAGLLRVSFVRRSGRSGPGAGRPAKLYAAAPELEALEFPSRRLPELLALLAEGVPKQRLRRAGEAFGRLLAREAALQPARDVGAGLDRVCRALGRLGFQVAVEQVERDRAVLVSPTCPLRPVVVVEPEVAEVDRGMWAALAEAGLAGVRAERVACHTAGCSDGSGSCRIELRLSKTR